MSRLRRQAADGHRPAPVACEFAPVTRHNPQNRLFHRRIREVGLTVIARRSDEAIHGPRDVAQACFALLAMTVRRLARLISQRRLTRFARVCRLAGRRQATMFADGGYGPQSELASTKMGAGAGSETGPLGVVIAIVRRCGCRDSALHIVDGRTGHIRLDKAFDSRLLVEGCKSLGNNVIGRLTIANPRDIGRKPLPVFRRVPRPPGNRQAISPIRDRSVSR